MAGALRDLNNPSVEVRGLLTTKQVQEEMARAWALVMPSRADTSPNVVKEARVIGMSIIVSPHGGHAEYVEHGVDGLQVDSEDPDAWFTALDSLCADFVRCKVMGRVHHQCFREHFRPKNTADQFMELYRELVEVHSIT